MRAVAGILGPLASLATIISVIVRLRWHRQKQRDAVPTKGQIWRKRLATAWLVIFFFVITIVVAMFVISALGDLLF